MAPHHSDPTFWQWLGKFKLTKIILLVTVILLLVPLVIHYYLITLDTRRSIASVSVNSVLSHSHSGQSHRDLAPPPEELAALRDAKDMETRVRELLRIRGSVGSELREMENTRQKLQGDIQRYTRSIEQLKLELQHQQTGLSRLKISVQQAQVAQREALQQNTPDLALPARLTANAPPEYQPTESPQITAHCRMFSCFDHSRCSLTGGFPVYLYEPDQLTVEGGGVGIMTAGWDVDGFLKTTLRQVLGYNPHLTGDPNEACIYLVLVGEALRDDDDNVDDDDGEVDGELGGDRVKRQVHSRPLDGAALTRLPYWGGDGRNHVLLNLARREMAAIAGDVFRGIDTGKAILVQSTFNRDHFRPGFDLVIAPVLGPPGGDVWLECAPMVPARRHYLLTFQGEMKMAPVAPSNSEEKLVLATGEPKKGEKVVTDGGERAAIELNEFILEHLRGLLDTETSDKFKFEFECVPASDDNENTGPQDWALCGTDTSRRALLRQSTFTLIFAPGVTSLLSTTLLQARVYEALRSGAVPIILGGDQVRLPYDEVIQWRRLVLFLPRARITELHFLLRTFADGDILAMRRQGRLIWERYLASVQSTLDTIIAVIRDRLNIPPLPAETVAAPSVFNDTFQPVQILPPPGGSSVVIPPPPQPANGPPVDNGGVVAAPPVVVAEAEESLGPLEPPYDSPAYQRNFSLGLVQGHEVWNDWGDPFRLYPAMPNDPVLPSDAKFQGSGRGFRPIALGQGGSGKEFSESLGGNHPREQFTVLLLTYEREQVLLDSISRLRGLPYLHSVVVVWNSPRPPSADLRWPDIGAPLHVVKAARNSLNNRFLPLDGIETEAVLSVDDDAHLRHDEILFGFRVWREHRDRIVGFPGRYHAWDINTQNSWLYNSNYSCELSMVLTGAAFLHSHYLHLYWKWLPQAIRDKVDEYMNCEDIAMNFLVSHITRAPPIKVTSRWTFRCPGCPQSLSEDETHFQERHKCINFFTQVFGYMPLLNTQYRADSILFKTRIPHDKQKCFKFI